MTRHYVVQVFPVKPKPPLLLQPTPPPPLHLALNFFLGGRGGNQVPDFDRYPLPRPRLQCWFPLVKMPEPGAEAD